MDERVFQDEADIPEGFRLCAPKRNSRSAKKPGKAIYCHKVKREYVDGEPQFKTKKDPDTGVLYLTNQCMVCAKATARAYYDANKDAALRRARESKDRNREKVRKAEAARARAWRDNLTPEQRREVAEAARVRMARHYADPDKRAAIKKRSAQRKARIRAEARANIPHEVLRPYVEQALVLWRCSVDQLAVRCGLDGAQVRRIVSDDPQTNSVTIDVADRLVMHALDCTLQELTDRSREWAALTGEDWPAAYLPHTRGYRERVTRRDIARTLRGDKAA